MNGRVFAVNRSPVLAWNIEPQLQVPYPDMPAAAAAAISPIVPAASDPYGRCWQNQVDAGTSFSYFGALYNNSLPPTAYRLQPGCMPALGQFWPPTPPPDGCGRFDGNSLYFGPPVLRHAENMSSNIRSSFPSLGHYSHLVETPKEQNQRLFKRETPVSPNVSAPSITVCSPGSKSDNLNSCCVVDSKMKSQSLVAYSLPKQELHTVSSGHEPYLCSSDIRSSSMHPSTDKSCFSPSHSLKNSLNFHSTSQDNSHRAKVMNSNQENYNASPLKNVYFSHYESENVSSIHSKNFDKNNERPFQFEQKSNSLLNGSKSRQRQQSPNSYLPSYSSKMFDFQGGQEFHNGSANCNMISGDRDGITLIREQYKQKSSSYKVKPEKNHSDCKYQKSVSKPAFIQGSEFKNSDMFNIPTSVIHPKIEPSDKYFLPSCSSAPSCMAASSYSTSGPFLMTKNLSADHRTGVSYQNSIYQNSSPLGKPVWNYNDLSAINLNTFFQSPEAAKPPSQNPPHVSSAFHEGLISVAQTAPHEIDVPRTLHQTITFPTAISKASEIDDEVQIIGIQTKHSSTKHDSRHSSERKLNYNPPVYIPEPLCLKNEKEEESNVKIRESSTEVNQKAKAASSPHNESIVRDQENKPIPIEEEIKQNSNSNSRTVSPSLEANTANSSSCITVSIKQELVNESESSAAIENVLEKDEIVCNDKHSLDSESKADCTIDTDERESFLKTDEVDVKRECFEEDQELGYSENYNLNLLLNTIEKVASFEKTKPKTESSDHTVTTLTSTNITSQLNKPKDNYQTFCKTSCVRGLDFLSAIAGQIFVSEFDVPSEVDQSSIKCNYPEFKQCKQLLEDEQAKHVGQASSNPMTSVFEIQNRLAELKKKYKQKQKELSRLKPKRRFASSYLKSRQKTLKDPDQSSTSNTSVCTSSENLNTSINSSVSSDQDMQKESDINITPTDLNLFESKTDLLESKTKRTSRFSGAKREPTTQAELPDKRITRSLEKSKSSDKGLGISDHSKSIIKKNLKSKVCKIRKSQDPHLKQPTPNTFDVPSSKPTKLNKDIRKRSDSLPENAKRKKVYSLRHSPQNSRRKVALLTDSSAINSKAISSKRKSDNPKKYIPSKQIKLSETIIAKHLRSRILFDTSGSTSDDDNLKDGVPDDLYVALMECHLSEENKSGSKLLKNMETSTFSSEGPLGYPEPSKLCPEHLVERQRLLALEDGLFYAGCIKENQVPKTYGIALDGQRGNRLHMFTREELLTQAIVESKPLTPELPEGTRVCAYWSQQYRCLYPGIIGKAPCPSADWSEPRVFVLFDDGDSGQIATKNVRLIPPDIIPAENICRSDSTLRGSSNLKSRSSSRNQSRRLRCSTPKITKHSDTSNENESKESSCASINESSCDDSCFIDCSRSPSHTPEDQNTNENGMLCSVFNSTDNAKLGKKQRKRSKRRTSRRTKLGPIDAAETKDKCEAKTKRHKKYKEKHRRHHHHHHRHHHHHHHHHHSKKRKHRRKNAKLTPSQDLEYENCIPCNSNLKSRKEEARACTNLIEHSSTVNLPQSEQNRVS